MVTSGKLQSSITVRMLIQSRYRTFPPPQDSIIQPNIWTLLIQCLLTEAVCRPRAHWAGNWVAALTVGQVWSQHQADPWIHEMAGCGHAGGSSES